MNKSFQPHESHIPYILQFMIDHNLYGMSQLFVPEQLVIHRHSIDTATEGSTLQKLTQSSIEFDMMAIHILNRALLYQKNDSNCVNPGIASLWEDEKLRRGFSTITELEPPLSQVREYVNLSKSDQYFRDMLKAKLSQKTMSDTLVEERLNTTEDMERLVVMADTEGSVDRPASQPKSQKSKSSQSGSLFSLSGSDNDDDQENSRQDLDQTIVNEELVLSLTQNPLSVTCKYCHLHF